MKRKKSNIVPFERNGDFYFRRGFKYADKRNYAKAAVFMGKAIELEPFNVDYQFNLAGILSEMGQTEKSNAILKGILINIDPTLTECYFGIGCNYFDVEDFSKAREYFEKYLHFDPDGPYAGDVEDVLYYLQFYDGTGWDKKKVKSVSRLVREGEKLLGSGDYQKACLKFETALEADPGAGTARNFLSMAHYLNGDVEKAISLANSVLKLDLNDINAHCNLALFYSSSEKAEEYKLQIKILYTLKIKQREELLKVLDTCVRLKEFSGMGKVLRNYMGNRVEFIEALEKTLDGWEIQGEKRQEIVKGLSSRKRKVSNSEGL